ncbi:MAG: methyl-accepting chemotaxis protein [Bacteroidetes bacterium]|nr:methyl-accepting chemotaxis protein [Bacteroidota bacterium]
MKWFYDLKIRTKLLMSFMFAALIASFIGYTGISKMSLMNGNAKQMYEERAVPLVELSNTEQELYEIRLSVANLVAAKDASERAMLNKVISDHERKADELMTKFAATNLNPEEKRLFKEYKKSWEGFKPMVAKGIQLALGENEQEAHAFEAGEFDLDAKRITEELDSLITSEEHLADSLYQEIGKEYSTASIEIYLVLGVGIAFAFLIGIFISNYLSKSINQVVVKMNGIKDVDIQNLSKCGEQLANGDLDINLDSKLTLIEIKSNDEIGILANSLNQINAGVQNTVKSIGVAVSAIKDTVLESNMLAEAAVNGNLSTRGNVKKFNGSYKELVGGLNATVDAVVQPINESSKVLEKLAQGDLTVRMTGEYKGDYAVIKNSINSLADSFGGALSDVSEAVHATASASSQISSSSEEMAAGAQEQSSQTAEVASAVEQMTKTIFETTKNSARASESAKNAGTIAKDGGKVVSETIEGMNRIADVVKNSAVIVQALGKSSNEIGEIVQVIDDIADQTNLLALNAAIEAARAGEQGRGFAVVADEVRKLAERTTKATKEIATMIRQIQKDTEGAVVSMNEGTTEVEKGKVLADKAGQALKQIISGAEEVVDISTQVAAASEEQSSAAEQISRNIESISSVTNQSASGVQQIARAAEDLNRMTVNLQDLIARFKLDEGLYRMEKNNALDNSQSQLAVRSNGKLVKY